MLFNQQSSMKEKLKSGFESSCDWTSVILDKGHQIVTTLTTKPHQDIIVFAFLTISISISLYNLSQKGTFQINVFRWPSVRWRFRLRTCIADIWTTKSWHRTSTKCWFRNKYENNKTGLYWKFKVYARFVAIILSRLNPFN